MNPLNTSIRSDAQIAASKINGSKSTGPITSEGKARSSQNATKLGLYSTRVVLANESTEEYQDYVNRCIAEWRPAGQTEADLLMQMVNAMWRIRRIQSQARAQENSEMFIQYDACTAAYQPLHADMRQADAALSLVIECPSTVDHFGRAEARLERLYKSGKQQLIEMQAMRLSRQPELVPQPALTAPGEEPSGNEPAIIGNNYTTPETFAWFSKFTPTKNRPTADRRDWVSPAQAPPEDKAA